MTHCDADVFFQFLHVRWTAALKAGKATPSDSLSTLHLSILAVLDDGFPFTLVI